MKHPLIILSFSLMIATVQASELEQLWQQLRDDHPGLKARQLAVDVEQAEQRSKRWQYGPTLKLTSRYTRLDEELGMEMDVSSMMPGAPPVYEKIQDIHYAEAQLEARLPLYTGGRIAASIDAAGARVSEQQAARAGEHQTVLMRLTQRYYDVILARRVVTIREHNLASLDRHVYSAKRRESEGLISRAERLAAEVQRDDAKRTLAHRRADLDLAILVYRQLVGKAVPLPQPRQLAPLSLSPDPDRLTRKVLAEAPEVHQLKAKTALARAGYQAEVASWKPEVALFGRVELVPDSLTALQPGWAAGIAFEWQLLDRSHRGHSRVAAQTRLRQLDQVHKQRRRDLVSLVRQRHRDVLTSEADIEALASSEQLVRERLEMTRKGFEQGLNTALDLVDAEQTLASLRLQRLKATVDQHRSLASLYIRAGEAGTFFAALDQSQASANPHSQ